MHAINFNLMLSHLLSTSVTTNKAFWYFTLILQSANYTNKTLLKFTALELPLCRKYLSEKGYKRGKYIPFSSR